MTDEYRRDAATWYLLAEMLKAAGLTGVEPGMEVDSDGRVNVRTRDGLRCIGTYPSEDAIHSTAVGMSQEVVDYYMARRLPWAELYTELVVAERTRKATEATMTKGDRHRSRARLLKDAGLSAAQIGARMAAEDGRAKPYDPRQVREWLAERRKRTA